MTVISEPRLTQLLQAWGDGDEGALERLTPLVYSELRRIARAYMRRERPGHTLQATALVNEAFVRLVNVRQIAWRDRGHFFALAARLMRRVLTDAARARGSQKRDSGMADVAVADTSFAVSPPQDLLALDEALTRLTRLDPRQGKVVELRFFGGFSVEETAEALGVSSKTVIRDWNTAKVWLFREMTAGVGRSA
jgi:RNA polymerase sigma factor (TIGR02999 family)